MQVSVITPSFNQGRFIEKTLLSVSTQKERALEHVVIDGGSKDETIEFLRQSDSLAYWISEPDRGQAHAVNKGLKITKGEIIGWLNSDDIYYRDTISTVIEFFNNHPEVDVVYGMADHIDEQGHFLENYPTEPWSFNRLKETCFICQPALFFRRSILQQHGLLNEKLHFCMDYEYWLRLGKAGVRFAYLEKKLAGSRLYPENKTLGSKVKVHQEINGMFKNLFGRVPSRWIFNYAHVSAGARADLVKKPILYNTYLIFSALWAMLYWNRMITPFESFTMAKWLKNVVKYTRQTYF